MECGSAIQGILRWTLGVGRWTFLTENGFSLLKTICGSAKAHPWRCQFARASVSQRGWRPVFCDTREGLQGLGRRWKRIRRLCGKLGAGDSRPFAEGGCGCSAAGRNARPELWDPKSVGSPDGGIDLRLDAIDRKSPNGEQRDGSDDVIHSPRTCVHGAR